MGALTENHWHGLSHSETGKVRDLNEDSVFRNDAEQIWAVADGMGGHEYGDYASQSVVANLNRYRKANQTGASLSRVVHLLKQSNAQLIKQAEHHRSGVIGCTVAVLSIHGSQAICSWCGDSRIYRFRHNKLLQLTRDHNQKSLAEDRDLIRYPTEIDVGSSGEYLTHAIGGETDLHLEHCVYSLLPDDRFLICTDGLYKEAKDEEIAAVIANTPNPDEITRQYSELYNTRGARDNMALVYVYGSPVRSAPMR